MTDVSLSGVEKRFGEALVIRDVSLDIADGELCVFVGPSGCGKSTLLRLVAGLEDPTAGDIIFDGERVNDRPPAARGIAMVFQSYALYPHMTVRDNMAFGLKLARYGRDGIAARVAEAARTLQIEPLLDRKPRELSGGQRQRVAIGRAIVREPGVFLFDEPLSNLDAALRVQMRVEIARLHREIAATMIYVTHDQVEAMTLAERIVVLNEGAVEQVGPPLELYERPRNMFVAGFIGSPRMNFIEAEAIGRGADSVTVVLPGGGRLAVPIQGDAAGQLTLGVRPEHITCVASGSGALAGTVLAVEHLGNATLIHLAVENAATVIVQTSAGMAAHIGEQIGLEIDAKASHLFGSNGEALGREMS